MSRIKPTSFHRKHYFGIPELLISMALVGLTLPPILSCHKQSCLALHQTIDRLHWKMASDQAFFSLVEELFLSPPRTNREIENFLKPYEVLAGKGFIESYPDLQMAFRVRLPKRKEQGQWSASGLSLVEVFISSKNQALRPQQVFLLLLKKHPQKGV